MALGYLQTAGLLLVTRNYRCRGGELDLIMQDGRDLVFVEVRFRSHTGYGGAIESIDRRKQRRLITAARHYLQRTGNDRTCRFDVVGIGPGPDTIEWLKNAIEAY